MEPWLFRKELLVANVAACSFARAPSFRRSRSRNFDQMQPSGPQRDKSCSTPILFRAFPDLRQTPCHLAALCCPDQHLSRMIQDQGLMKGTTHVAAHARTIAWEDAAAELHRFGAVPADLGGVVRQKTTDY